MECKMAELRPCYQREEEEGNEEDSADDDSSFKDIDDDRDPLTVTHKEYIWKICWRLREKHKQDKANCGKWMLFYDNNNIFEAWKKARYHYDARDLDGVSHMKVSTACMCPRSEGNDAQVIIFYCGPASDKERVMSFGYNILKYMDYKNQQCNRRRPAICQYMYYKTDYMTFAGTRSLGVKKNHLYKIPFSWNTIERNLKDQKLQSFIPFDHNSYEFDQFDQF